MTTTLVRSGATPVRPHVAVLADRCAGCQACSVRCPVGALHMDEARWIVSADDAACIGCRQCVRTCPFSAITVEGPVLAGVRTAVTLSHPTPLVGDATEVRRGFASYEEARAEANRCLQCPDPTCVRGCPAHNDIPAFIAAIRDSDLELAHEILRRTTVLPDVCSRVCDQASQCEGSCSFALAGGEPVAIGRLERFVTEALAVPRPAVGTRDGPLSVAIVGSGPAGIGAAYELLAAGADVTLFERDASPGGLLTWGIPDFTLPDAVASRPWRDLAAAGVIVRCGAAVDGDDVHALLDAHDAVVLAHGASVPIRPPIDGADLDGVVDATAFLKAARTALAHGGDVDALRESFGLEPVTAEGATPRVLVLGAGNTAMDVARSARRCELAPLCVDWVDERFAIARPDELAEARHEGVEVRFLTTVARLVAHEGRVVGAELAATEHHDPRKRPSVLDKRTTMVRCDLVVMAMGYRCDATFSELVGATVRRDATGLPDRHWTASGLLHSSIPHAEGRAPVGRLALGREVGVRAATHPVADRVWVAGDALVGPSTVVEAMAQGRRAAQAVLVARPSRCGRPAARRALVCYESRSGTTARAAAAIASALMTADLDVRSVPVSRVTDEDVATSDLLVVGTWVEGFVVAGVRPARAMRAFLARLPKLGAKPAAAFCTYVIDPRGSLGEVRAALESHGADVVAVAAFGPRDDPAGPFGPGAFGAELAAHVSGPTRPEVAA